MKTISKTIDDIPVIVVLKGSKKNVIYHLPQGMSGWEFANFKAKNKLVIDELIRLCNEKE